MSASQPSMPDWIHMPVEDHAETARQRDLLLFAMRRIASLCEACKVDRSLPPLLVDFLGVQKAAEEAIAECGGSTDAQHD